MSSSGAEVFEQIDELMRRAALGEEVEDEIETLPQPWRDQARELVESSRSIASASLFGDRAAELRARLIDDLLAEAPIDLAAYAMAFPSQQRSLAAELRRIHDKLEATRLVGAKAPLAPGGRIAGFELERELGRGAQGVVWLARDAALGRVVALKLLDLGGRVSSEARERWRREAGLAGRLEHPGICAVLAAGCDDGYDWIAMRYIEGQTLAQRLSECGSLARADALEIIRDLALALAEAHRVGVVHRDVKPSNVLLEGEGRAVLLDFGLACLDEDQGADRLTRSAAPVGTPDYMAPEQLERSLGAPSAATDLWALGVSLYEACSGVRPFQAPTRDGVYRAILNDEFPPHPELRGPIKRVLEVVLDKDPQQRYRSALDLATDLEALRVGEPVSVGPPGALRLLRRSFRRAPALWSALIALAFGLSLALAFGFEALAEGDRARRASEASLASGRRLVAMQTLHSAQGLAPRSPSHALSLAMKASADLDAKLLRGFLLELMLICREQGRSTPPGEGPLVCGEGGLLWRDGRLFVLGSSATLRDAGSFDEQPRLLARCGDDLFIADERGLLHRRGEIEQHLPGPYDRLRCDPKQARLLVARGARCMVVDVSPLRERSLDFVGERPIEAMAVAGGLFAVARDDGSMQLGALDSGLVFLSWRQSVGRMQRLWLLRDASLLLGLDSEGLVWIWGTSSGEMLARWPAGRGKLLSARVSVDESVLVVVEEEGRLSTIDLANGIRDLLHADLEGRVRAVSLGSDGS